MRFTRVIFGSRRLIAIEIVVFRLLKGVVWVRWVRGDSLRFFRKTAPKGVTALVYGYMMENIRKRSKTI